MAFHILNILCILQMVFQFFKSTNYRRVWQVAQQQFIQVPQSSALARLLISFQRNIIEIMCVHRSSHSLFPSIELEYQICLQPSYNHAGKDSCPKHGGEAHSGKNLTVWSKRKIIDSDKCYKEK